MDRTACERVRWVQERSLKFRDNVIGSAGVRNKSYNKSYKNINKKRYLKS